MTIALLVPPALEPVTLVDVKAHMRIDTNAEDTLISDLIKVGREHVEHVTGQKLLSQTWRQYEPGLGLTREVCARVGPVQSINAVTIYAQDGTPRVLAGQEAWINRTRHQTRIAFAHTVVPAETINGVEIDLVVGMADTAIEVPGSLRHAILLLVAHWYEFRGAVPADQQPVSIPPGFEALVRPHCEVRL
ncbi:MAG: head-tail connector protein [Pseudomonadota bacterium]